ncbi:phosphomannomutase/phosphoglucomutase [Actinocorallia longicatena]|uniref:Phosphomannomutase/phosphoglucomutase n=1 Tax=Actinocorallia longicatena TaxID=111803 RepID=A0ABP6QMY5_9ACTN
MGNPAKIFKAYDVRGVVPEEFDEATAEAAGAAFVRVTGATEIVTAHDMRASSVPLAAAFARGATAQGADVIEAGLGSTDLLYYASGVLDLPGVMFTASHNPARYNGMKMCTAGARPIGQDTGLRDIRDLVIAGVPGFDGPRGSVRSRDLLQGYADHLNGLVDLGGIRPLKVVVDAGNGMGGHTVPAVLAGLPLTVVPLYFELDGTFPHHEANPIEPENLRDLQKAVLEHGADLGLAFDGDADRCFAVDERGEIVSPSAITALVAERELAKHPGANIVHNLITSLAVPEVIRENGGTPIRTRVGHSFIKKTMADTGAVFGGEHSAHFYFRDFWFADSGMLAALHVLAALGEQDGTLSALLKSYDRYAASGEINSEVADQEAAVARVRAVFAGRDGVSIDELDGTTFTFSGAGSHPGWWFNLRASNTEPLLRLNAEATDATTMAALRDEVLAIVRGG